MRSFLVVCSSLLAALALAACGGSGGDTTTGGTTSSGDETTSSVEDEVGAATVAAVDETDPKVYCRTMISDHLVAIVYEGQVGHCLKSDDSVPEKAVDAEVTAVEIDPADPNRAEVAVDVSGGELDGSSGDLVMVREGGAWKLDDYSADYLRSAFLAEIKTAEKGAVSVPSMKACFSRQVRTMDAGTIRELTFASNGGHHGETNARLLKLAENCPNALVDYGVHEFTAGLLESNRSPAYAKCVRHELRYFLTITGITPELFGEDPSFAAVAALEGIATQVKKHCEAKS